MSTEPDNLVLQYLRRFDAKPDRVIDEMLARERIEAPGVAK